jgi:histidinol-phosphatase (PHP family)
LYGGKGGMELYYDYHVHTDFSEDSSTPLDEACIAAIEKNVAEIAVTDHLDIDYPDRVFQFDLDYTAYSAAIDKAREKFDGRLSIIKGLEIGLQPHILGKCASFMEGKDFRFVIASVHSVSGMDLYREEFHRQKTKRASYTRYLEELLQCIKSFKSFNVVGHIDLIRRYGNYSDNRMKYSDFGDLLDLIFEELISTGRGIELNTSGFRYNLQSTHPDFDLLKRYREMGGEILTIGSDAHTPYHLAEYFDVAYGLAKEAGFKYITRFPCGKPEFVKL